MVRPAHERVLLIGDVQNELRSVMLQAVPGAVVTSVASLFDGIAELSIERYSTILAAAEPLERRPEAAVRTLREVAGDARLLLFGHPTLEILSRKMLQFGCDDYVVTPAGAEEFRQILSSPPPSRPAAEPAADAAPAGTTPAVIPAISNLSLAEWMLDALLSGPADPASAAITQINAGLAPEFELRLMSSDAKEIPTPPGRRWISNAVRNGVEERGTLHLAMPAEQDESAARHLLARLAPLFGKLAALQDRHNQLQRLAITDELTGLANARYFRHFLSSIMDRARKLHFPVTLLLFDIDDFKKYNDRYGHATGDEILRQAATMMRRCTRQHDLVARIGGDEFAVVFWDKEGPRQPRDPRPGVSSRPPQEPLQIFERFKGLIASEEFPLLGQSGKGLLTVSAGLAVFPWDATEPELLIQEADRRLMMGAKRNGKNSIQIVGAGQSDPPEAPQS